MGGLTFHVRTPWGLMRGFVRRLAEIEAEELGERARQVAVEEAARELLGHVVVGCEEAEGDGQPAPWRADRLDELDAVVVAELLRRLAEPPKELGTGKGASGWPWCGPTHRASQ